MVRKAWRFLAPAKTKLQREQKWELQRPPAGPINTYKCLSKQSFNDGYSTKIAILPKRLSGGRGRGSSVSSSASDPSQEENEYSMHGNSPDLFIIIKIKIKEWGTS